MRRVLALLGVGLALLAVLLLLRTVGVTSQQLDVLPATLAEVDGAAVAERLALAVRERTISHQDVEQIDVGAFEGFHTLLRVSYPRVHSTLELEKVADLSLLYTWKGRNPELDPVLSVAHLDVVPIDSDSAGEWEHPPFEGVIADGAVWGRGTIDDKARVVCLLDAIELLISEGFTPERSVLVAIGHDEELGGSEGAVGMASLLAERGTTLAWVLDEGGVIVDGFLASIESPVAVVGIAEKGSVGIGLSIEAPGGHSSIPSRHTAIGDLAAAVVALENNPMPASLAGTTSLFLDSLAPEVSFPARVLLTNRWLFGPLLIAGFARLEPLDAMVRTTTAVTIFESGVKENVLPVRARAIANFRIHPNDSIDSVVEHVRDTIDDERIELQVGVSSPPTPPSPVSSVDSQAYLGLSKTIRSVFQGTAVVPYLVMGRTDSRHYYRLTDNVYRFAPFTFGSEALRLAHGTNERISVENLVRGVQFFVEHIRSAAGAARGAGSSP